MGSYADSFQVALDNTAFHPDSRKMIASVLDTVRHARRIRGYIASGDPVHGSSTTVVSKVQEGYDQDTSFAMIVTLTSPDSLEGIFENLELKDVILTVADDLWRGGDPTDPVFRAKYADASWTLPG